MCKFYSVYYIMSTTSTSTLLDDLDLARMTHPRLVRQTGLTENDVRELLPNYSPPRSSVRSSPRSPARRTEHRRNQVRIPSIKKRKNNKRTKNGGSRKRKSRRQRR